MCFLSTTLLNAPAYHPLPPILFDQSLTFWSKVEVERRGGTSYLSQHMRGAPGDSNQ